MKLEEKVIKLGLKSLEGELDTTDLKRAEEFMENEIHKNSNAIKSYLRVLEDNECDEKDSIIFYFLILGLGRNRACSVLTEEKVGRREVEKIRDLCELRESNIRKENEKFITSLKWDTKTRKKREELISDKDWEEIKAEYLNGASPMNIGDKYGVSGHIISMRLRTEGLFDELRSTLTKNKIAEENLSSIDDSFIINLMNDNKYEPVSNVWRLAQKEYPWLLRRQFLDKLSELGLERTDEEVILLKTDKSRIGKDAFELKQFMIDVIEETIGDFDEVREKYKEADSKVFAELAEIINKGNSLKVYLSEKQVQRIITDKPSVRTGSIQQDLFFEEIKKILPEEKIFEEYRFKGSTKVFDIYVKSLNLAIDFNGDFWHSDDVLLRKVGVTAKEHHQKRVDLLKDLGVKLIYVWHSDWKKEREKILKLIKNGEWEHPLLNKLEIKKNYKENYKENAISEAKKLLQDLGFNCKVEGDTITLLELKQI